MTCRLRAPGSCVRCAYKEANGRLGAAVILGRGIARISERKTLLSSSFKARGGVEPFEDGARIGGCPGKQGIQREPTEAGHLPFPSGHLRSADPTMDARVPWISSTSSTRPARVHHDALSFPANFDCSGLPVGCRCRGPVAGGRFSIHLPAHHDDEYAEIEGRKNHCLAEI